MAFKKGDKKPANSGMKKGAKTERTQAWEQLGDFITDIGAQRAKEIMLAAPPDKFMFYYSMFIEYFKPKRSRVDENGNPENKMIIQVIAPDEVSSKMGELGQDS